MTSEDYLNLWTMAAILAFATYHPAASIVSLIFVAVHFFA